MNIHKNSGSYAVMTAAALLPLGLFFASCHSSHAEDESGTKEGYVSGFLFCSVFSYYSYH